MLAPKDYIMVCHGCGKFHTVHSAFISSSVAIRLENWCIPCYSCVDCRQVPERIYEAWKNGMSADARAKAQSEFESEWKEKLIAASQVK
jgi:hypothetical protein